jgi:hypothetical protein
MVEKVVNVKVVDNVEATTKNVANLKTQLRQAQNEVNELSAKFGATSKQAVEAAKRASELKDAIGDAKALTDAFNPDAKFKALTSTLGGVAGGFAAVQGAVGLLGTESQDVEKMILKVQSAMAITQGIQAVGESVDNFKQLLAVVKDNLFYQKALAAAIAIQNFVMNGATLAAKAFRGALVATGIGALVVGIGLLVANFDKLKSIIFGGASNAEILNKKLKETISLNDELVSQNERSLKLLEAQGANEEKIFATKQRNLTSEIAGILEKMDAIDEVYKAELKAGNLTDEKKKELQDQYDAFQKQATDKRTEYEINQNAKVVKEVNDSLNEQIKREDEIQASKDKKEEIAKEKAKRLRDEAKEIAKNAKKANDEIRKTDLERLTEKYNAERSLLEKQNISTLELEIKFLNDKNELNLKQQEIEQKLRDEKIEADKKAEQDYWFAQSDAAVKRTEEDIAREKKVAEEKRNINALAIQSAQNVVSILAGLGEKNKKIQKIALVANGALSIAEIINNTNVGSSKEVATKGVFGLTTSAVLYAKMALSIGSVIAATAKGLSALGGGGSVGGSGSANGGGATQTTAPQFNIVGQSGTNQLAQTIAGQQNRPIEAFVVSSAVTTSQALDRNRVKTATFGG